MARKLPAMAAHKTSVAGLCTENQPKRVAASVPNAGPVDHTLWVSSHTPLWWRESNKEPATCAPAAPVPASVPSGSALQASWASGWGTSGLSPICTAGAGARSRGRGSSVRAHHRHERSPPPATVTAVSIVGHQPGWRKEAACIRAELIQPSLWKDMQKWMGMPNWPHVITWMSTSYSHSSTNGESTVSSAAECGRGAPVVSASWGGSLPAQHVERAQRSGAWLMAHTKQQQRALHRVAAWGLAAVCRLERKNNRIPATAAAMQLTDGAAAGLLGAHPQHFALSLDLRRVVPSLWQQGAMREEHGWSGEVVLTKWEDRGQAGLG